MKIILRNNSQKKIINLKENILKNYPPDKIVLASCNLSQWADNKNHTLNTTLNLAEHDIYVPIVSYNKPVGYDISGKKIFVPYGPQFYSVINTKRFKLTFNLNKENGLLYINDDISTVYIIKKIKSGELNIELLINHTESDPIGLFKNIDNPKLVKELIHKLIYNDDAYILFLNEIAIYDFNNSNKFINHISEKLNLAGITEAPLWEMITPKIDKQKIPLPPTTNEVTIIFRSGNSLSSKIKSKYLAEKYPNNTIVIQADPNKQEFMIEYGDINKIPPDAEQKWLLIHSIDESDEFAKKYADLLKKSQLKYHLQEPTDIQIHIPDPQIFYSTSKQLELANALSQHLQQHKIETPVGIKLTFSIEKTTTENSDIPPPLPPRQKNTESETAPPLPPKQKNTESEAAPPLPPKRKNTGGDTAPPLPPKNNFPTDNPTRQSLLALLRQCSLNNQLIETLSLADHPYLAPYFTDTENQVDLRKIQHAINDPLISPKVHAYLITPENKGLMLWNSIFRIDTHLPLPQQIKEMQVLLNAISDDPPLINRLSDSSLQKLAQLLGETTFPMQKQHQVTRLSMQMLLTQPKQQKLNQLKQLLDNLATLPAESFKGENAIIKAQHLPDAITQFKAQLKNQFTQNINGYDASLDTLNHVMIQSDNQSIDNISITLAERKFSLRELNLLGATIKDEPLNSQHIAQQNWQDSIQFDAKKLNSALTFLQNDQPSSELLHLLKTLIDKRDISSLIPDHSPILDSAVLKNQLTIIQEHVRTEEAHVDSQTLSHLQAEGVKLPRYARFFNRTGQASGAMGMVTTLTSLYTLIDRLAQHDLNLSERREAEKQFALTCSQGFFNYGDMLLQPVLLRLARLNSHGHHILKTLPAKVSLLFNVIGMGFDAYQAYDLFSQLNVTTDNDDRQDLIVNGTIAIGSFVVGGVTFITILVGSTVVPAIGLFVGSTLLLGGMIYNGVRTVERIEKYAHLEWYEKLEEGLRAAIGLPPTHHTIRKMNAGRWFEHISQQNQLAEIERFRTSLLPFGFERYLTILGDPIINKEETYHLVSDDGHFFGGDEKICNVIYGVAEYCFTQDNAPIYTEEEADEILTNHRLDPKGKLIPKYYHLEGSSQFTKRISHMPRHWMTEYRATNDTLIFNTQYRSPQLQKFIEQYAHDFSHQQQLNLQQQINALAQNKAWLLALKKDYPSLAHPDMDDDIAIRQLSEKINNSDEANNENIYRQLSVPFRSGTAINPGTGTDIMIGKAEEENAFIVADGLKYFAGGNKDDQFQLWGTQFTNDKQPDKYLDGLEGTDSLFIRAMPKENRVYVDLQDNIIKYKNSMMDSEQQVAHIINIENIFVQNLQKTDDLLFGDDNHNILSGGNGQDRLYGRGGDDQLLLTEGEAYGGDGNDKYYIERIYAPLYFGDFYLSPKTLNTSTAQFEQKTFINPKYKKANSQNHSILIDEITASESFVSLDYSLNEIESVSIVDTDMILKIKFNQGHIGNQDFAHLTHHLEVKLKNVYFPINNKYQAHHQYHIQTRDGFLLTSRLPQFNEEQALKNTTYLLDITYLQNSDRLSTLGDIVDLNIEQKKIFINANRQYHEPTWGKFNPLGQAKNYYYRGDDNNNEAHQLSFNSTVHVSLGVDSYSITPNQFEQNNIIFDFHEVWQQYSENDKLHIKLPTENGYQLKIDKNTQTLYLNNPFGGKKLTIQFVDVNKRLANNVQIEDKDGNLFTVQLDPLNSQIIPVPSHINHQMTQQGIYVIPQGYCSSNGIIELNNNDRAIVDHSQTGHLLLGNEYDNNMVATSGYNIFYAGAGNNVLYGGDNVDLFISDNGNDVIKGGDGDDHYFIDGNGEASTVYIDDNLGKNHIHLVNFSTQFRFNVSDNGILWHRYTSNSGRVVNIRQTHINNKANNQIYHYTALDSLDSNKTNIHFADYSINGILTGLKHEIAFVKKTALAHQWQPISAFENLLRNTGKTHFWQQLYDTELTSAGRLTINLSERFDFKQSFGFNHAVTESGPKDHHLQVVHGNNVLYGGGGNNILSAGIGNDVLISNGEFDKMYSGAGETIFVVDGTTAGKTIIINAHRKDKIYLVGFDRKPVKRPESLDSPNEYVYHSPNGRAVGLMNDENVISAYETPSIYHVDELPGLIGTTTQQRIDYLVSAMASQLAEDAQSHKVAGHPDTHHWQPVSYFERYIRSAL